MNREKANKVYNLCYDIYELEKAKKILDGINKDNLLEITIESKEDTIDLSHILVDNILEKVLLSIQDCIQQMIKESDDSLEKM